MNFSSFTKITNLKNDNHDYFFYKKCGIFLNWEFLFIFIDLTNDPRQQSEPPQSWSSLPRW